MRVDGSAVRGGMVIEYEGRLCFVVKHEIRTPGNLRAFNQVELKDVINGTKKNIRLNSGEAVERVHLDDKTCQYLYAEGDSITLMDPDSYEQFTMPKSILGDAAPFLSDNMMVAVQMHEGKPLSATLPGTIVMEVVEADPVVKGQTAASSYKPAKLANGERVMVPPFIGSGTMIEIKPPADGEGATYIGRAK